MRHESDSVPPKIQSRIPVAAARPTTPRLHNSPLASKITIGSNTVTSSRPTTPVSKRVTSGIPLPQIVTHAHQPSSFFAHRSERACCTALKDLQITPPPTPSPLTRNRPTSSPFKQPPTAHSPTISSIAKRVDYPTPPSIAKRGLSPSRLPIFRSSSSHSVSSSQRPVKRTRAMSYELPKPHVVTPCTQNSLTHRLVCSHLIMTTQPTGECAGNCLDARGKPARSPYSIPSNPRNLDKVFVCPKECRLDSTVFPPRATKRRKLQLCQIIPESIVDEEAHEERVRSVALLSPYLYSSPMLDEYAFGLTDASATETGEERIDEKHDSLDRRLKSPDLLAGIGHKRTSSKHTSSLSSFSSSYAHNTVDLEDHDDEDNDDGTRDAPPRTPEPRHQQFSDFASTPCSPGAASVASPTPSMVNRHRLSRIMMHKAQRDSAISVSSISDTAAGAVGLGIGGTTGTSLGSSGSGGGTGNGSVSGGSASARASVVGQTGLMDLRMSRVIEYA